MAKANLPVNFKDDILKENMNGKRRFNMIQNGDGTVSFEDVTDYTQVGSTFGAAQINATNTAVNNAADASKIIDDLDTIKANTKAGYIAGALAAKALSSNLGKQIYDLGTGSTFDVSSYAGYENFNTDNFIIEVISITSSGGAADNLRGNLPMSSKSTNVTKTYNNGKLTINNSHSNSAYRDNGSGLSFSMSVNVSVTVKAWLLL